MHMGIWRRESAYRPRRVVYIARPARRPYVNIDIIIIVTIINNNGENNTNIV